MVDLFQPGQRDYIQRLNQLWQQFQAANNQVNPTFNTFGGSWAVPDTRPGKKAPQDYKSNASVIEFNNASNFDNPPGAPYYAYVLTVSGWTSDGSGGGGFPVQFSFGENLAYRRGTSGAAWTAWKRLVSYDDRTALFGGGTATAQNVVVGGDATTSGAAVVVQNGGTTMIAIGNKSGVVGGAYNPNPYIYGQADIESNVGLILNRPLIVQGVQESIRLKYDSAFLSFWNSANTARSGFIQAINGYQMEIGADVGSKLMFTTNGSAKMLIDLDGHQYPTSNGGQCLGLASNKFRSVFADTGAIQTSDARRKTAVKPFTAAMRAAAREMHESIGVYQWLDAVAEKGQDKARWHVGLTVQCAIAILEKHGLAPFSLGFVCHDVWPAEYEKRQTNVGAKVIKHRDIQRQKVIVHECDQEVIEIIDDRPVLVVRPVLTKEPVFVDVPVSLPDGSPALNDAGQQITVRLPDVETVSEPYEADADPVYEDVLIRDAGEGYSFRYDELTLFILAGLMQQ